MIQIAALGALIIVLILFAPTTPTAQLLRSWVVDEPVRRLSKITRGHAIVTLATLGIVGLVLSIIGHEAAFLLAQAMPELIGLATTFDIVALVDAAVAVALIASTVRLRALSMRSKAVCRSIASRVMKIRKPHRQAPAKDSGANDNDDDHHLRAIAA